MSGRKSCLARNSSFQGLMDKLVVVYWIVFIGYMGLFLYFQHTDPLAFVSVDSVDDDLLVSVRGVDYTVGEVNAVPRHWILDYSWLLWVFGIPALLWNGFKAWPKLKELLKPKQKV